MKKKIVLSMVLAMAGIASIGLVGCDSESAADSVTGSSSNSAGFAITGRLAGTGFKNAQVCLDGICVYPDATTGKYTLTGSSAKASSRVAARSTATTAIAALDTAYIIVGNDTLKEIPITSWNSVIPEKYIVQRNVAVTVPTKYTKGDVQFVYWDNDSIAHAVGVPKTSGLKHSAYVYTYYDSTAFTNHDTVFSWFARIKLHDSVKTGTAINKLTYDAGDIVVDSSDFQTNVFTVGYYKYIPAGDTVNEYTSPAVEAKYEASIGDTQLVYTIADTTSSKDTSNAIYIEQSIRHAYLDTTYSTDGLNTMRIQHIPNDVTVRASIPAFDSTVDSVIVQFTTTDTVVSDSIGTSANSQSKFVQANMLFTGKFKPYNYRLNILFESSKTDKLIYFKTLNVYVIRSKHK
jgi:hypothetical protein